MSTLYLQLTQVLGCVPFGDVYLAWGYTTLINPNQNKTAVHSCQCQGDMVVCMRKVLAVLRGWYVCFSAEIGIDLKN